MDLEAALQEGAQALGALGSTENLDVHRSQRWGRWFATNKPSTPTPPAPIPVLGSPRDLPGADTGTQSARVPRLALHLEMREYPRVDLTLLRAHVSDELTPLVRTDFTDDAAWERVVAAVLAPSDLDGAEPDGDWVMPVVPVDDPAFAGATGATIGAAWSELAGEDVVGFALLADSRSMTDAADPTVVYVDLYDEVGREFRCVVPELASIEVNLSIANMDFHEFADSVAADGVFRGF
jgi:hypothetical protein